MEEVRVPDQSCPTCEGCHQHNLQPVNKLTYMGTIARPPSVEADCWCLKYLSLSRADSREASRSVEGIFAEICREEWSVEC